MANITDPLIKALTQVQKANTQNDPKLTSTAMRFLPSLRKHCSLNTCATIYQIYTGVAPSWAMPAELELNVPSESAESRGFLMLLVTMILIDQQKYQDAKVICEESLGKLDSRSAQPILAKFYFYKALCEEKEGVWDERPYIICYRGVCLNHDIFSQSSLINIIVRTLLAKNMAEQANQFVTKTEFPQQAPYYEVARYHYYIGRLNAIQLNYSDSFDNIIQAQRKAAENTGNGFKLTLQKLKVVVELLMGEIPTRKILVETKGMNAYLELVRAVRSGQLDRYQAVLDAHKETFHNDNNLTLVARLRHIVIKLGLRKINVAYSAISLQDLAQKVGLPVNDTEYIVAKAIRDRVIEAYIDHEQGVLRSKPLEDIYSTFDPQQTLSKRVNFCMELRNDAVRAMLPQVEKKQESQLEDTDPQISDDDEEFSII